MVIAFQGHFMSKRDFGANVKISLDDELSNITVRSKGLTAALNKLNFRVKTKPKLAHCIEFGFENNSIP